MISLHWDASCTTLPLCLDYNEPFFLLESVQMNCTPMAFPLLVHWCNPLIATFKLEVVNQVGTNRVFGIKDKTLSCGCGERSVSDLPKHPIQIGSLCLAKNILEGFESMQSKQILWMNFLWMTKSLQAFNIILKWIWCDIAAIWEWMSLAQAARSSSGSNIAQRGWTLLLLAQKKLGQDLAYPLQCSAGHPVGEYEIIVLKTGTLLLFPDSRWLVDGFSLEVHEPLGLF